MTSVFSGSCVGADAGPFSRAGRNDSVTLAWHRPWPRRPRADRTGIRTDSGSGRNASGGAWHQPRPSETWPKRA